MKHIKFADAIGQLQNPQELSVGQCEDFQHLGIYMSYFGKVYCYWMLTIPWRCQHYNSKYVSSLTAAVAVD